MTIIANAYTPMILKYKIHYIRYVKFLNIIILTTYNQSYRGGNNSIYKCLPKVERLDVYRVIQTININCTYIQRSFIM